MRVTVDTMPQLRIDVFRIGRDHLQDSVGAIDWKIADVGDWCIRITGNWRDRDTRGEVISASYISYWYGWGKHGPTKKQLAKAVRTCIIEHLTHEVDEGLWVDGERMFDPHK